MKSFIKVLRYYLSHPLGRINRLSTFSRILRWQIGSRILRYKVAVPFVNGTRLLVDTGMHGATGNISVGLMEFSDMAFVLHLLNEKDTFVDIGANVGTYTVIAASRGAQVLSLEPIQSSYQDLLDNVHLNRFESIVRTLNIGISSKKEELRFTTQLGPTNHVVKDIEVSKTVTVQMATLDEVTSGMTPTMLKIDVEGFEAEVIRGADQVLSSPYLEAILIELNGSGLRYGFKDKNIHQKLVEKGFEPIRYDPFMRKVDSIKIYNNTGNTLYIRSLDYVQNRLKSAAPIVWNNITI